MMTNQFGCDSLVITHTAQLPVDPTWLFQETCIAADTGLISNQLVNQYGCDSLVYEQTSLLPAAECQLDILILGDTISCLETLGSAWFTFLNGTPPFDYTWTDHQGNVILSEPGLNAPSTVSNLEAGTYQVTATNSYGDFRTTVGIALQVLFPPK